MSAQRYVNGTGSWKASTWRMVRRGELIFHPGGSSFEYKAPTEQPLPSRATLSVCKASRNGHREFLEFLFLSSKVIFQYALAREVTHTVLFGSTSSLTGFSPELGMKPSCVEGPARHTKKLWTLISRAATTRGYFGPLFDKIVTTKKLFSA
ncbi:hypothetical protein R1flu_023034 [Riccia fluitans]|uniref:Uncharacterized protein n=1 Tax=Riccia fluitans TaxID=41844 RepID=A0ABD1XQW8_9MARC